MIVKVFPSKGGGSGGSMIDYLCGKDREREQARVLRGNPDETLQIIQSLNFSENYFAGCLSFEEKDIDEKTKIELMNSFEECLFTGLDANQWNCLWVEHTDKGRLELNFVIPKVELTTGRALNPYWKDQDFNRVDLWKDIQNDKHGFTNPNDPQKRRMLTTERFEPKERQDFKEALTEYLLQEIKNGNLTHSITRGYRDSIVEKLEEQGLTVVRQGKDYISIKHPTDPNGKNLRLKGGIYDQSFRLDQKLKAEYAEIKGEREPSDRTNGERLSGSDNRLRKMEERYRAMLDAKRNFHIGRYINTKPRNQRRVEEIREKNLYSGSIDRFGDRGNIRSGSDILHNNDNVETERIERLGERDRNSTEDLDNIGRENERSSNSYLYAHDRKGRENYGYSLRGIRTDTNQQLFWEKRAVQSNQTEKQEISDDRDRANIVRYAESVRSAVQQSDERIRKHNGSIRSIGQTSNAVRARKPINERFRATVERLKQTLDQFRNIFSEFQETVRSRVNQIVESRQPKQQPKAPSRSRDDGHGMSR